MKLRLPLLSSLVAALLCNAASALSVQIPSFTELVGQADLIAKTEVADVRCQWQNTKDGKVITTTVTFKVLEAIKGTSAPQFEFTQLGGQVGSDGMHIAGLPEWHKGERDILFVAGNGKVVCPLVGITHGRYWVVKESGVEYVAKCDGAALADVSDVSSPVAESKHNVVIPRALKVAGPNDSPLTVADFTGAVRAEIGRIEKAAKQASN